jgi:streptogramin lyase
MSVTTHVASVPVQALATNSRAVIYKTDFHEKAIFSLSPDSGVVEELVESTEISSAPLGIAVGPDSSVYWTEAWEERVCRREQDGTTTCQQMPYLVGPLTFCAYGRLFAGMGVGYSTLYELDPQLTTAPRRIVELSSPIGQFAFCGEPWLCVPQPEENAIVRVDVTASNPEPEIVVADLNAPRSVDLDLRGGLCVVVDQDDEHDAIVRYDRIKRTTETLVITPDVLGSLVIAPFDRLFFSRADGGEIFELLSDGAVVTRYPGSLNEAGVENQAN